MQEIGIFDGSLAIVDKSLRAENGSTVIAYLEDGFTLKQLKIEGNKTYLMPFNSLYKPLLIDESNQAVIWGRVTYIINKML